MGLKSERTHADTLRCLTSDLPKVGVKNAAVDNEKF